MVILIIGPSGSGKDTQAAILAEKHGFVIHSTGELMRKEIAAKTEIGKSIESLVLAGELAPDQVVMDLLEKELHLHPHQNIILTGAVRTSDQVELLDKLLGHLSLKLDKVLFFDLEPQSAAVRMQNRQRSDDELKAINKKLELYKLHITPILEKYQEQNVLITIDASKPIPEVAKVVEDNLRQYLL